ncbi:TPA: helix-turn-helix domain-containing protein, partial [Neisseria gonorrhoeae]
VAQIAGAVGYDCPSRFSARFKELFGCVPSVVRSEAEPAAYRRTGQVSVGVRP